jgi:hypothetical protein
MLLRADVDEINQHLGSMEKDRRQIERQLAMISFYMQGGLSYLDGYKLSMDQVTLITEVISEHYDKVNQVNSTKTRIA